MSRAGSDGGRARRGLRRDRAASVGELDADFDPTATTDADAAHLLWRELRAGRPVASSPCFGGTWFLTRHDDVVAAARDPARFSSRGVIAAQGRPFGRPPLGDAPPITADPPAHAEARRRLQVAFTPAAAMQATPAVEAISHRLLESLVASAAETDAAVDAVGGYARHLPRLVLGHLLGLDADELTDLNEAAHVLLEDVTASRAARRRQFAALRQEAERCSGLLAAAGDLPLLGRVLQTARHDGAGRRWARDTLALLALAGTDTVTAAVGTCLWHLATHEEHQRLLREALPLAPSAVEELLRICAPVTMGRITTQDVELRGRRVPAGSWVLLGYPSANRDATVFEDPDGVDFGRAPNPHVAFGVGLHRCLGAHLARVQLRVAVEQWLQAFSHIELDRSSQVEWSGGQIRGPRELPLLVTVAPQAAP